MPMNSKWIKWTQGLVVFCLLVSFYSVTRPLNHSESYDSLSYVLIAENFSLGTALDSRNILFHAFNRIVVVAKDALGLSISSLNLLASISIMAGALSLILFARLMKSRFGVSAFSAYAGAAFLGLTYGYWRYTGAVEVYVPSMFLNLCSITLIFNYLENRKLRTLVAVGVLSGLAVLFYQPNIIILFGAAFVLFCSSTHLFSFVRYSIIGAVVVLAGILLSFIAVVGTFPDSFGDFVSYVTSRNNEFRELQPIGVAAVKSALAFGHDVLSAHWTRVLDPVRDFLDPFIPGCVFNFNVVISAGKGLQHFVVIAAVLFVPILVLLARISWIASRQWKFALPKNPTLFLMAWLGMMGLVVGSIDPGGFEAWIPVLVPFVGLFTILVIEPCYQMGKKKTLLLFLVLLFCYNFFGGMMVWRNTDGDEFLQKTQWVCNELTEKDMVMLNEFDYRMVDYLLYYSKARVAYMFGDTVKIGRGCPIIESFSLDDFLNECKTKKINLYVLEEVLLPTDEIKQCRYGEEKFDMATELAARLKSNAVLVDSNDSGDTFQIKFEAND